jgi:hypothetical protein
MHFKILITLAMIFAPLLHASAQSKYQMKGNEKYVEIDFLSSYYSQDGNNGAVTGGIGTEQLSDFANIIVVNVPIDSVNSVNATFGLDNYTSASTDNIDNNRSSASRHDTRGYGNVGYNKKNLQKGTTYGARIGFSSEFDYTSVNAGATFVKEFNQGNTELAFSAQAFVDQWKTYFPIELRGEVSVPTRNRNSFNAQVTLSQVLTKRLQMSLSLEGIYMNGLLSTPFHRVYFSDLAIPDIERLPSSRLKIPLAIRLNYKPTDNLILRSYYRYYTDDFGINAHTFNLEIPYHINNSLTVAPFYRYHTQTGSDYFAPYAQHLSNEPFYTSDYDLSELTSSKFGIQVGYSPLYGLTRAQVPLTNRVFMVNSVGLRLSRYTRDTGLSAYGVSVEVSMRI